MVQTSLGQEGRRRCGGWMCEHGGGVSWEIGMDVRALPCMLLSGNVLPSAGNSAGCSVMTEVGGLERGGRFKRKGIYAYI